MNWELRIEAISWLSLLKIHKFWKKLFISSFYPRLTLFLLKLYFTHSTSSLNKCYASFEPTISWYVFRRLSRNHEKKRKITGKRLLRATCNINLIFESRRNDIYDRTNYRLIVSLWPPTRGLLKSGWKPEQTWGDPDCQQPSPWGTPRRWARSLGQERDERRTSMLLSWHTCPILSLFWLEKVLKKRTVVPLEGGRREALHVGPVRGSRSSWQRGRAVVNW